jgi:hypothetical protein
MSSKQTDAQLCLAIEGGSCPEGARGGKLDFTGRSSLRTLPAGLRCHTLILTGTKITKLPADLQVDFKLVLNDCVDLTELPPQFSVPVLVMQNCVSVTALPEGLAVDYLDASGCTQLAHWPESAQVRIGTVRLAECASLRRLPMRLGPVTSLDLRGCRSLECIPEGVVVRSWIDLAQTQITGLPASLAKVGLRWRGVAITPQIAFFPETISVTSILEEPNAEVRRVMIERIGFERFLADANAEKLHEDTDPGGPRELLRVKLVGDEDLVCVSVRCPSTGRHYLIRVPPTMKTCHQAIAWTAGFDDPDSYRPLVET